MPGASEEGQEGQGGWAIMTFFEFPYVLCVYLHIFSNYLFGDSKTDLDPSVQISRELWCVEIPGDRRQHTLPLAK